MVSKPIQFLSIAFVLGTGAWLGIERFQSAKAERIVAEAGQQLAEANVQVADAGVQTAVFALG